MDHGTAPTADGDLPAPHGSAGSTIGDAAPGHGLGSQRVLLAFGRSTTHTRELAAATRDLWTLSDDELVAALEAHHTQLAQHQGVWLAVIRELDTRGHHTTAGATSTAAWLSHHLLIDRATATNDVAAARALDPHGDHPPAPGALTTPTAVTLAATGRALLAGEVSRAHADAIRTAITKLPTTGLPPIQRGELLARAETTLLGECPNLTPSDVRTAGTHLRHLLDPDGVLHDERTAEQRATFWIKPEPDGVAYRYGGTTDPITAAQLTTLIDAHSAPRPDTDPETGLPCPDPRTSDQRRGHAFADLVRLAVHADPTTSGGQSTHLVVTVPLDTLCSQLGEKGVLCGTTETGQPLSAATIRRLACDTTTIPMVLGAKSEPLDVGRATRTIPAAIRKALNKRDRGCAFPTCTRPTRWADAHHITHWADAGTTDLHNLVLLCGHHHDTIHHTNWTVTITDGRPRFTPPMRT